MDNEENLRVHHWKRSHAGEHEAQSQACIIQTRIVRGEGLEKAVMLEMGGGSRSRGRLRRRWLDEVVEVTELSLQHLKESARDINGWRKLIYIVTKGRDRLCHGTR